MLTLEVLDYIAQEVERQGDGPMHVAWMARAWEQAMLQDAAGEPLSVEMIEGWGRLVEPLENGNGFRTCDVRVGGSVRMRPWDVRPALDKLVGFLTNRVEMCHEGAGLAYREFEKIHPFRDGNGRTGKILLNFLARTLHEPFMPPNFFNCSNP